MKSLNTAISSIADKISNIENLVQKNTQLLKESLSKEHQFIIENGIKGFKNKILDEYNLKQKNCPKEQIHSLIRQDKALRYPHRKILNYLIEQYDFDTCEFNKANFSRIVKECKIGKNMAKAYLEFLVEKGYLRKTNDGYRVWYRIDSKLQKGDFNR